MRPAASTLMSVLLHHASMVAPARMKSILLRVLVLMDIVTLETILVAKRRLLPAHLKKTRVAKTHIVLIRAQVSTLASATLATAVMRPLWTAWTTHAIQLQVIVVVTWQMVDHHVQRSTSARQSRVLILGPVMTLWISTHVHVKQAMQGSIAMWTSMSAAAIRVRMVLLVQMALTHTPAVALMDTLVITATLMSMNVRPVPVKMVQNAKSRLSQGLCLVVTTFVCACLDTQASIVQMTSTSAPPILVNMVRNAHKLWAVA
jgi:hypothetical protein